MNKKAKEKKIEKLIDRLPKDKDGKPKKVFNKFIEDTKRL